MNNIYLDAAAAYGQFVTFIEAIPARIASAVAVVVDQVKRHMPAVEDQDSLQGTALAARDLRTHTARAPESVPELLEVRNLLFKAGFTRTQELGPELGFYYGLQQDNAARQSNAGVRSGEDRSAPSARVSDESLMRSAALDRFFRALAMHMLAEGKKAPSCQKWMTALIQAGADANTLEFVAQRWDLPSPQPFNSWTDMKSEYDRQTSPDMPRVCKRQTRR
ncbi:MAG: hypothetical protein OXC07_06215 [Kistimonas sp.]|nr:hypothetical protein [Kistimonas sp.]